MYFPCIDTCMLWNYVHIMPYKILDESDMISMSDMLVHINVCLKVVISWNVGKYDVYHNHVLWFKIEDLVHVICHKHELLL